MRNPNPIEEIYVNLDIIKGLGLMEDDDVRDALVTSGGDDFTVVPGKGIYGNTIDITEFEERLTIKNERSLSYYASR